ncbi:hypothetical protein ACQH7H_23860 [Escherichia coli]|uniref:hypothetical protein n=1 Tax=Escherichia coli TaxID=562 RepID=UPI003CF39B8B
MDWFDTLDKTIKLGVALLGGYASIVVIKKNKGDIKDREEKKREEQKEKRLAQQTRRPK